jgi:DNA-binding LytR/AlgR family response regulator
VEDKMIHGEDTNKLRVLIVDDEYPAREELRYLLRSFPEIEVVGEAAQASEALELIRNIDYDLCFLDVKMPGESGVDLVKHLAELPHKPAVIFVTAYPDYAVEAFDLDAVDYLLKPFDQARLTRALQRLVERGSESMPEGSSGAEPESVQTVDKIPVPDRDRTVLVDADDIVYVTAARGYSYLVTAQGRHLVPYSLADLERRLRGKRFFRTHRGYLINLERAKALEPDFNGGLQVVMDDERTRVPVSRRHARRLKHLLGL